MATVGTAVARPDTGRLDKARVRDLVLVGLTLSTGCVDAISWLGLGKVFSAFMTGNLVFLGFAAGGAAGPSAPRVIAATVAFGGGAAAGARIVRARDPQALWPGEVTLALLAGLALQAAFLVVWLAVNADPADGSGDMLIVLSASAMGIQTAAIFSLGIRADFTTAATATLAVLMGDLAGWKQPSRERARLGGTLAALVAGALTGAALMTQASSWAPVVPLALTAAMLAAAHAQLREGASPPGGRPLSASGET
jgi:uncharacterized membrane protein YoaK (UPF0700 family)